MSGLVTLLAPYLIIFGAGLGLFSALRLLWRAQPPWLETAVFSLGCLAAFWALERPDAGLLQDRVFSVVHAAIMLLAGVGAGVMAKGRKWIAVLWALGLSWLSTCLILWLLTVGDAPLTWSALGASGVLSALLWLRLGRPDGERPITLFTVLLLSGLAILAAIASFDALSASLLAVLTLLLAGGAVALYRPALMPHGVTGAAGLCVAVGATALAFSKVAAVPSICILALTLFSFNAVQFKTPAGSGLEVVGRRLLTLLVSAVPLALAVMVGYVTLTNP